MHTGARAREQKYISIYISLCMKTFLKTGVYIYIYIYIYGKYIYIYIYFPFFSPVIFSINSSSFNSRRFSPLSSSSMAVSKYVRQL